MNKKTVTIGIGNSDDKLSQREWAYYCAAMFDVIQEYAEEVHFNGFSLPNSPWQSACFVIEIFESNIKILKNHVQQVRAKYRQNAVAWIEGDTERV